MLTILEVLTRTTDFFASRGIPSARLDAELILSERLNLTRVELYLQFEQPLSETELNPIRDWVRRRAKREPLAWILGHQDFYAHRFIVTPGVLVPRPDTETLVISALSHLPEDAPSVLVDVGCGTGCVGLSLIKERPQARLFALDLSPEARACTAQNADALGVADRVTILDSDLLSGLPDDLDVDVIVSNPPYIAGPEFADLQPEVRDFEPRLALDGGADGLDVYGRLIPAALSRARRAVLVEIGYTQGDAVREIFDGAGAQDVVVRDDLSGNPRVVEGRPAPVE